MAVSKRTRYEVLRRDNNTCRYCRSTENALTIDHVVPTALGGSDDPSNLVAACKDCNAGKTSTSPDAALVAEVSDDAVRWSAAMKLAAERMGIADEAMESRLVGLGDYWYAAIPRYNHGKPKWRLPSDWRAAVARLLDAGLPDAVVFDCIDIAVNQRGNVDNAFRYMLGVAGNKLANLQDEARAILSGSEDGAAAEATEESGDDHEAFAYMRGYDRGRAHQIETASMFQSYALSRVVDGNVGYWLVAG